MMLGSSMKQLMLLAQPTRIGKSDMPKTNSTLGNRTTIMMKSVLSLGSNEKHKTSTLSLGHVKFF